MLFDPGRRSEKNHNSVSPKPGMQIVNQGEGRKTLSGERSSQSPLVPIIFPRGTGEHPAAPFQPSPRHGGKIAQGKGHAQGLHHPL